MADRLKGKLAFCTASGAGIGRATAIAFAREGARVIASDLNERGPGRPEEAGVAECVEARRPRYGGDRGGGKTAWRRSTCSSMRRASCTTARCSMPPIRTGTSPSTSTSNPCTARSRRSCRACWPRAAAPSSTSPPTVGAGKAAPNRYVYGATKAAVVGLTKAVAIDFIGKGIRCNCICPGTIETPSLDDRIRAWAAGRRRGQGARNVHRPPADGPARHRRGDGALSPSTLPPTSSAYTTGSSIIPDGGFTL